MSLKDTIFADLKTAMKAKEADKVSALRFIQAAIKNKEIEVRPNEINEEDIQVVLKKLGKQLKDAIVQYENAGRDDLADNERMQLDILTSYLPEQMTEEQVAIIVDEVIAELNADSMKQMGQVMQAVLVKTAGAADNKVVSSLVKAKLQ